MSCGYCDVLDRACACRRPLSLAVQVKPAVMTFGSLQVRIGDGPKLTILAPGAAMPRCDLIVKRADDSMDVIAGMPAHQPVHPATPEGCEPIAAVRVNRAASLIASSDITLLS